MSDADKQAVIDAMSLGNQRMAELEKLYTETLDELSGVRDAHVQLCLLLIAVLDGIVARHGTLEGTLSKELIESVNRAIYSQARET